MIRYFIFYFSTYEPRAMRRETPSNYIYMLFSHAQPHLIFIAVCVQRASAIVPHLKDELTGAERLISPHIITWTFPASRTFNEEFSLYWTIFPSLSRKIQLYIWAPNQMWPSNISFLALLGGINPFLYSPLIWFVPFYQHSSHSLCHQLCLCLDPWADTGLHNGKDYM